MCFTLYILWNVWNDMLNQSKQQAKLLDPLVTLISIIQPDPEEPFFFFFLLGRHAINKRRLFHPDSDRFSFFFFPAHLGYLVYRRDR